MTLTYKPNEDGETHVNIYSGSRCELGRLCSNFAHMPFVHLELGTFASMEGFYYYVSTGERHEELRELSGFNAKSHGKRLSKVTREDFETVLLSGLSAKYAYHKELFDRLFSEAVDGEGVPLPFVHYYVYGTANEKVVVPKGSNWLINGWASIRSNALNV